MDCKVGNALLRARPEWELRIVVSDFLGEEILEGGSHAPQIVQSMRKSGGEVQFTYRSEQRIDCIRGNRIAAIVHACVEAVCVFGRVSKTGRDDGLVVPASAVVLVIVDGARGSSGSDADSVCDRSAWW